ncbi:hypothetical protein P8936_02500 [Edaphobacter paludis]|uniref:Uncharacterized protein n=1 Tax=Edaphobacter paludis TaxID=3035702 RepID=A0AAU7DAE0_9BACT
MESRGNLRRIGPLSHPAVRHIVCQTGGTVPSWSGQESFVARACCSFGAVGPTTLRTNAPGDAPDHGERLTLQTGVSANQQAPRLWPIGRDPPTVASGRM